jgi:mono/diheme cytochrome c family protein
MAWRWSIAAWLVGALVLIAAAAALLVYAGVYNVAADIPHSQPVYWLLQTVRPRSIAVRARDIVVPADLDNPKRIASGASEYREMCSRCHLAPGMERTEISRGLYPRAPELRRGSQLTQAEEFWVVKHGIKATGMPAWGVTHDDELLWDIVAFLRKLPELSPDQYQALVKSAPRTHEEMMRGMEMDDDDSDDQFF